MSDELISYLKLIEEHPKIPATKRDEIASISNKKGNTLRKRLAALGLIEEFWANPGGQGKKFRDVRLTEKAKAILA